MDENKGRVTYVLGEVRAVAVFVDEVVAQACLLELSELLVFFVLVVEESRDNGKYSVNMGINGM